MKLATDFEIPWKNPNINLELIPLAKSDPEYLFVSTNFGFTLNEGRIKQIKRMWGKGLYFAEKASYSNDYCFKNKQKCYLLFCKVFVGDSVELKQDSTLVQPPFRDIQKKIRYI